MKKKNIFLIIIIISAFACRDANKTKVDNHIANSIDSTEEDNEPEEIELTTEQIKAIDLELGFIVYRNLKTSLKVNGRIMLPPENKAEVSLLTSGIVKNILVREGSHVTKGQTLAIIQNNDVVQLQQDYLENKSQLKYLELEFKRQKELQEENINSTKQFQQIENDLNIARAKQKGIASKLELIGINASLISTSNLRNYINVVAPIAGYIQDIKITMGKFADANSTLFEIVDNKHLHLDLTVFEKDIHKVKVGQKIVFSDANDASHTHPATVYSLDKAFQENQQAILVHAQINETTETLLPGMFVEARINITNDNAPSLPNDAIIGNGEDHFIFIETKPNHYKQIAVKVGASDLGFTEIKLLESIPEKNRIVTKGAYYLFSQLNKGSGEHHH